MEKIIFKVFKNEYLNIFTILCVCIYIYAIKRYRGHPFGEYIRKWNRKRSHLRVTVSGGDHDCGSGRRTDERSRKRVRCTVVSTNDINIIIPVAVFARTGQFFDTVSPRQSVIACPSSRPFSSQFLSSFSSQFSRIFVSVFFSLFVCFLGFINFLTPLVYSILAYTVFFSPTTFYTPKNISEYYTSYCALI